MRALLMRGADRTVRDKKGKLPVDLVQDIKSPELQKELLSNLEDKNSCDCLMLK